MRVVAVVQARMGSTRLPGKVLQEVAGEPMLARVVTRASRAESLDAVIVATSDLARDEPVEALCRARGWEVFCGSESDVLDRYHGAAVRFGADVVVRITADCPLIDPREVDRVVATLMEGEGADCCSNSHPVRTFPRGLDVEAMRIGALETAWREARAQWEREHVTPYLYAHPDRFVLRSVRADADHSHHRWTVDVPEDLELVRRIYDSFAGDDFGWRDVLRALAAHPEWSRLNSDVRQKPVTEAR